MIINSWFNIILYNEIMYLSVKCWTYTVVYRGGYKQFESRWSLGPLWRWTCTKTTHVCRRRRGTFTVWKATSSRSTSYVLRNIITYWLRSNRCWWRVHIMYWGQLNVTTTVRSRCLCDAATRCHCGTVINNSTSRCRCRKHIMSVVDTRWYCWEHILYRLTPGCTSVYLMTPGW